MPPDKSSKQQVLILLHDKSDHEYHWLFSLVIKSLEWSQTTYHIHKHTYNLAFLPNWVFPKFWRLFAAKSTVFLLLTKNDHKYTLGNKQGSVVWYSDTSKRREQCRKKLRSLRTKLKGLAEVYSDDPQVVHQIVASVDNMQFPWSHWPCGEFGISNRGRATFFYDCRHAITINIFIITTIELGMRSCEMPICLYSDGSLKLVFWD